MKLSEGIRDNTYPLLAFFIMDVAYQVYCKDIKDLKFRFELRKAQKQMAEGFHKFNADFFMAFNADEQDYIIDQMDEFDKYIHTSVVILKTTIMDAFANDVPFEEKKTIAAAMACNVLAQAAQHVHMDMYRNERMKGLVNPFIEGVKKGSRDVSHYYPLTKNIDLTASDKVMANISSLCKKIVGFLKTKAS